MPKNTPPAGRTDPGRERDAAIVARIVELVHARRRADYAKAGDAIRELQRLGVVIRFRRDGNGGAR